MTDKLYLSWEDFHAHCRSLAELIRQSGKKYTRILAVSRGGLLPAGILAYELDIRDCEAVNMSGYDAGGRRRDDGAVELRADKAADEHTLVIDDISDSGRTFRLLRQIYPQACFAAVYVKAAGESAVDLFAQKLPDRWLVFPWDVD